MKGEVRRFGTQPLMVFVIAASFRRFPSAFDVRETSKCSARLSRNHQGMTASSAAGDEVSGLPNMAIPRVFHAYSASLASPTCFGVYGV